MQYEAQKDWIGFPPLLGIQHARDEGSNSKLENARVIGWIQREGADVPSFPPPDSKYAPSVTGARAGFSIPVTSIATEWVTRRLVITEQASLAQLHAALQVAFGWSDEHLYVH